MRRLTTLLPLVLLVPLVGCCADAGIDQWVAARGGTISDLRLDRADALARALVGGRTRVPLDIAVLDCDDLSAFSWPGGRIFVSHGLVDALDDAALSAAIAHEIAHLLNHRRPAAVSALSSGESPLSAEVRADALGVKLLASAGLPRDAMARMLEVVLRRGEFPPAVQADLKHRIAQLRRPPQLD